MKRVRKNVRAYATSILGVLLCAASLVLPNAVSAKSFDKSFEKVTLEVMATISGRCGFSEAPTLPTQRYDVTADVEINIPFKVDCNQLFNVRIASTNGGMQAMRTGADYGFATFRPYDVALTLGLSNADSISRECSSPALSARPSLVLGGSGRQKIGSCEFFGTVKKSGLSSGSAIAASDAKMSELKISWDAATGTRMLAGVYQDTLTIVVEPRT